MWLLKPKPPRAKRVCRHCAGAFGLMRLNIPCCSPYCLAWDENMQRPELARPPDELVALLLPALPAPILAEAHSPTEAIECQQVRTEAQESSETATLPPPSALSNNTELTGPLNVANQSLTRIVLN